jgi:hypothetical protein
MEVNTNVLIMATNTNVLNTASQLNPIKVRFCFIAIAKKSENKVPPMSNKNIIHLGTILKFLNMMFVFG